MALQIDHIEHLAKLAKLGITEAEKKKYAEQISSILDYFQQLKELDTSKAEPLAQIGNLSNVLRDDEAKTPFDAEKTLAEAPEIEKKQVKVKPVLNK